MMNLQHTGRVRSGLTEKEPDLGTARGRVVLRPRPPATPARTKGNENGTFFWDVVAHGTRPGVAGGLLSAWWLWERLAHRLWPTFVVPGSPYGLFRIRVTVYRGRPIDLPDCIRIDRGATICELHCDNDALLNFLRQSSAIYAAGRSELAAIANWVIQSETYIEAIFGVTLLAAAAARLGFDRRTMASARRAKADRLFMNGLLVLYSTDGVARLKRGRTLKMPPQEIWMSRGELLRRYGLLARTLCIPGLKPDAMSYRDESHSLQHTQLLGVVEGGRCHGYERE